MGGGVSTRPPWSDFSDYQILPGGVTASQTLTTVTIVTPFFTFAAGHVGMTIRWDTGVVGKHSLIKAIISPTQVTVDTTQSVAAGSTFVLKWDSYTLAPGGGPLFADIGVGRLVVNLALEYLNLNLPTGLTSFNDLTVIAINKKNANTCTIVGDGFVANHQLRRSYAGDNTTLFYSGSAGVAASAFGAPNNFQMTTCVRSGNAVTFRENKTARGGGNEAGLWTPREIGNASIGSGIYLAELLMYRGVLSTAELDNLYDNYFKPRWITLP